MMPTGWDTVITQRIVDRLSAVAGTVSLLRPAAAEEMRLHNEVVHSRQARSKLANSSPGRQVQPWYWNTAPHTVLSACGMLQPDCLTLPAGAARSMQ